MRYLEQYVGETTKEKFEGVMGRIPIVEPAGDPEVFVHAVEVTPYDSITSCIIYLDQKPPDWMVVSRRWPDGVDTHSEWKYERMLVWNDEMEAYTNEWRHFMSVDIGGGVYDPDEGQIGPFTFWLSAKPGHSLMAPRVAGIGWKIYTNHQHTNIYFSLAEPDEPEPPDPPDPPDPPGECCDCEKIQAEIRMAREHIEQADVHLAEADRLCDNCACTCS